MPTILELHMAMLHQAIVLDTKVGKDIVEETLAQCRANSMLMHIGFDEVVAELP